MFKRLLLEDSTGLCLTVAFLTASTIFLAFVWRAVRMPRTQADRFAQLPFNSDTAAVRHDSSV